MFSVHLDRRDELQVLIESLLELFNGGEYRNRNNCDVSIETYRCELVEIDRHFLDLPVGKILEDLLVFVMRPSPPLGALEALLSAASLRLLILVQKVILVT